MQVLVWYFLQYSNIPVVLMSILNLFHTASAIVLLLSLYSAIIINLYPMSEVMMKNSAFVFIKPHANNQATQELVRNTLQQRNITILREGEFTGNEIDEKKLIDQHYYAIASKATLWKAKDLAVPTEKFLNAFGESWEKVLEQNRAFNAIDARSELNVSSAEFDALWAATNKVKLGGGFYCGEIPRPNTSPDVKNTIYTFNGFFMSMRSKFVAENSSIHYFVVEFDPELLSWAEFRGKVLGPTDPAAAPPSSLRGNILASWKELGLQSEPNVSDNCVHASASPFEGLAEKLNWLQIRIEDDAFGSALLHAGISQQTIENWGRDPQVKGKSLFDQLEDTDVDICLEKMKLLNQ